MKQVIQTEHAPRAIGTYSQAIKAGNVVYLSGQIPLHPTTMQPVTGDIKAQAQQVFKNLTAVVEATGGSLENVVKLSIYLLDLTHFSIVNEVMATFFQEPYPARTTIGVAALPKKVAIEIDAIMVLGD